MDAQTDAILTEAREWIRTRTGTMESESLIAGLIAEVVRLANATEKQSLTDDERMAIELAAMEYEARVLKGVGLQHSGPPECGEQAAILRTLLARLA